MEKRKINNKGTIRRFKQIAPFQYVLIEDDVAHYRDFDESVADDSYFVPNSSAVARLSGGRPYSSDEVKLAYDFPDGKDSGLSVDIRRKGRDLAEISTDIRERQADIGTEISKAKNDISRIQRQNIAYERAKNATKSE